MLILCQNPMETRNLLYQYVVHALVPYVEGRRNTERAPDVFGLLGEGNESDDNHSEDLHLTLATISK